MGGTFDPDYGRMTGTLGVEVPNAKAFLQQFVNFPYTSPPTEIWDTTNLPKDFQITSATGQPFAGNELAVTPIASATDGSQIWKITHNGVDTHPIHFHLYDVQLLNRTGWDGFIRTPDPTELGWKDTVRISPLEDTFVAIRPVIPQVPFDLPNSVRLLNPAMKEGDLLASASLADAFLTGNIPMDPLGEPIDLYNHYVNFGHEYVWHCHILGHEEMDMMRSVPVAVTPRAPTSLSVTASGNKATLTWTDNSLNETGFTVFRANDAGFVSGLTTIPLGPGVTTYVDTIKNNTTYYYKVIANNVVGDTWDYTNPGLNEGASFPTKDVMSAPSNTATLGAAVTAPAVPTNFVATPQAGPQIRLTWRDNSNNETGFVVKRGVNVAPGATLGNLVSLPPGTTSYVDTAVASPNTYSYQVCAINSGGVTCASNTNTVSLGALPAAPTVVSAVVSNLKNNSATVTVKWTDNATNETGFTVKRATDVAFTQNIATYGVNANATTFAQSVSRNQTLYYCVQSVNANGTSPCVNALPLPTIVP
jgi:FtsP/CotA-like multicopper oxidase with cupredoxin domain